ncbi:MAG: acetyl-CoA C-acyltransferase [Chitinophagales bacterium]|nr:acetyl-CoA C-acyltransferase [Chitinophagales bacterium]MBP9189843.1 acetyl-CoA C-acyltransferase [Chitinophagales bacterium]MBP9704673.1 acetyl-CoA C-acyltransferase [Chitinophagales bacterium]
MKEVYIVSVARTPIGAFGGGLLPLTAPQLGAVAMKAAIERAGIKRSDIQEVLMGNVISAGIGQAPVTQAMLAAGVPDTTPSTTINKVCASGMKAIMIGAQSIQLGINDVVLAGGMESMSNAPYYLMKERFGAKLGHGKVEDGVIKDGLWDPYGDKHMGSCGETCAREYKFSREDQDNYAIESYRRAAEAWKNGWFNDEVVPVSIPQRKGDPIVISEDEDYSKVKFDKVPTLAPVFDKAGTITAANASNINDGASAMVLMSKEKADALGIKPIAKIIGYADAQQSPEWFTTAPSKAMPLAIERAGLKTSDIDFFEINEAFSVVALANMKELGITHARTNVFGGAVALGHPLGSSGARIVMTLLSVLKHKGARYGCAGICNGGGGASAMVIESV